MHGVIKVLMGQIVHWVTMGQVAANKIVHVGIPQARAIVPAPCVQRPRTRRAARGTPATSRADPCRRGA
jgi:hypothetical protein